MKGLLARYQERKKGSEKSITRDSPVMSAALDLMTRGKRSCLRTSWSNGQRSGTKTLGDNRACSEALLTKSHTTEEFSKKMEKVLEYGIQSKLLELLLSDDSLRATSGAATPGKDMILSERK